MMPLVSRSVGIALRIIAAGLCCVCIWYSWTIARADYLFHEDTEESLRSAIQLVPDGWMYYMRLSQFDRDHTRELLTEAVRLDPYNAEANIELGLEYEAEGDYAQAEKMLLNAFAVDDTYLPRWSLANYYFRRDDMPKFWEWAKRAAAMPSDDVGPLFNLCWHVSSDPATIAGNILNGNPDLLRQYLGFLLDKNQVDAIAAVASRLVVNGTSETDRWQVFNVVNSLAGANDVAAANGLWHTLIGQHWVQGDSTLPNNAEFRRDPIPVIFDWSLPEYFGLHSFPGEAGLESEFTGSQPEECTVTEQAVVVEPGDYTLGYTYHTSDIPMHTGLKWQIIDMKTKTVLAESPDLSSETANQAALNFTVPPGVSLIDVRLGYKRAIGTPRISGMLVVQSTQIQHRQ